MVSFGSNSSSQQSQVWDKQAPFLTGLYGMGQGLAQQQLPQVGQAAAGLNSQLSSTGGDNPWITPQLQSLQSGIQNQFQNSILPAISSQGVMGGTYGNDRMGVAQGLAAQGAEQAYGQGASGIMQNYLQQVPNLFQMGMSPYTAPWQMLQNYASVLGNPAILGSGSSSGFNMGLLSNIGLNLGGGKG